MVLAIRLLPCIALPQRQTYVVPTSRQGILQNKKRYLAV